MAKYIIAHDVGTSGNKAVLVDTEGRVHGKCFAPYQTHYPSLGWVEQEPADWWQAVKVPPAQGFNGGAVRNHTGLYDQVSEVSLATRSLAARFCYNAFS
jgi:glycerol kinase